MAFFLVAMLVGRYLLMNLLIVVILNAFADSDMRVASTPEATTVKGDATAPTQPTVIKDVLVRIMHVWHHDHDHDDGTTGGSASTDASGTWTRPEWLTAVDRDERLLWHRLAWNQLIWP